jgi:shikimate kinase
MKVATDRGVSYLKRVLVTGMSGTGKSTVLLELAARGYKVVDTDYDDWTELVDMPVASDLSGVLQGKDVRWREGRMAGLLSTEDAEVLFVGGCAPNQTKFYSRFDHIVLLTAPISVTRARLAARTNNPYGKHPEELARVVALKQTVEPALRRSADVEIDTSIPVDQVVERILSTVLR